MDVYKVRIYSSGKRDLKDIVTYLNTLSPDAALRYYDLLVEKIVGLKQMPNRCPHVKNTALRLKGYRYLIVESYVVFFVIKEDIVQVRRILYGKQNYEWLLQ